MFRQRCINFFYVTCVCINIWVWLNHGLWLCAEEINGGCNAQQLGKCTVRVLLATLPGSSRACVLTSSRFQAMLWPVARTAIPGPSFPGSPCLSAAPRTKQWNRFRGMFSLPHPVAAIIITWKICSSYFICEIKCVGECDSMMGSHRFYKLEQLCSVTSFFSKDRLTRN